jgi:polyisoprenyl-phosphate glycosyltransferase
MPEPSSKKLISLVIPCYNESDVFPFLKSELTGIVDELNSEFDVEIIFVDDGSKDSTWEQIRVFSEEDPRVRGVSLSRNFGHQLALTCGYDVARGDAVICMDADLQDPPEAVIRMVEKWKEGYDIVYAVRVNREGETAFKLLTAKLFYRIMRYLVAHNVQVDAGDFRLMSRRALDALGNMREQHRFIRGMVGWLGFRVTQIEYERKSRKAGVTKYPLRKMVRLAVDAIVSFSITPLRLSFASAALLSTIILGYMLYAAAKHFIVGSSLVPGWTSLIIAVVALGAMNLISIGILGEYVGRIYEEVKKRPLYLIKTHTSNVQKKDN